MFREVKFKRKAGVDARYRSLLQKAVRRGHIDFIYTISALLKSLGQKERNWFTSRAAIITFEECWPLGAHLKFNKKFHSKVAALIMVAQSTKARRLSKINRTTGRHHQKCHKIQKCRISTGPRRFASRGLSGSCGSMAAYKIGETDRTAFSVLGGL
jgi:hypothetical protein